MKSRLKKILVRINLVGLSEIEKQSLEILAFLKDISEVDSFGFSYNSIVKKRLNAYFNGAKKDIFSNLSGRPLKHIPSIMFYLTNENYIEKRLNGTYVFTNKGLKKVYSLESLTSLINKFISTVGTIGGFVYALTLLKPIFSSILNWPKY